MSVVGAVGVAVAAIGVSADVASAAVGSLYTDTLTVPGGTVSMNGKLWVADHFQGFCRIVSDGAGGQVVDGATCAGGATPVGATAPVFDASRNLVYVADNTRQSQGVWRFPYIASTNKLGAGTLINVTASPGTDKPDALALSADGNTLYVGFTRVADIKRVDNPATATGGAVTVASSSDAGGVNGIALVGSDLFIAESAAVTKVAGIDGCSAALPCVGGATPMTATAPLAITGELNASLEQVLYVSETPSVDSAILRYNVATDTQDVFATTGETAAGATPIAGASGLSLLDVATGAGTVHALMVGDDPTVGGSVGQGRLWQLDTAAAPQVAGAPGAPATIPPAPGAVIADQFARKLTVPSGAVVIGSSVFVSDHAQGFCKLSADPTAPGQFTILNPAVNCDTSAGSPGQPSYDPSSRSVYVPDNSTKSAGVWRFTYNPTSATIGSPTLIAPIAQLRGLPTATALGQDGKLYIGYQRSLGIDRVAGPETGTPAVQPVGTLSGARGGTGGFGFIGPDLYLAENAAGTVTRVANAAACTGTCVAATTPIAITSAAALTTDNADTVYVADVPATTGSVLEYIVSTGAQRVFSNSGMSSPTAAGPTAFGSIGGLTLDAAGNLYVGDDPSGLGTGFAGKLWKAAGAAPLQPPAAAPATPSVPDLTAATDTGASSTDNLTNAASPTFTGTAAAGTTVQVLVGGIVKGSAAATATGAYTVPVTGMAEGLNQQVTAVAVNPTTGRASTPSAALLVSIDRTAPAQPSAPDLAAASDTGVSNTDNLTKATTLTFTGTADTGTTVAIRSGTTTRGTAAVAGDGTYTVTGSAFTGVNSVTAVAIDAAGNTSVASTALSVTVDTTVPRLGTRTPAPGATGVSVTANVVARFSENVSGVTGATVFLTKPGVATHIAATVTYTAATATTKAKVVLNPTNSLARLTTYTVTITAGIQDLAGNPLAGTTWSFTTA
ncbi:MAG TPA: Ig-like domain-containing protein [Dermatophilaceae bacterium]|nr:Ig-like domain-containing protein [Dermatophilaceae bacterium]